MIDGELWTSYEAFRARPFAGIALIGALLSCMILVADYLNNLQKKKRLGGIPIVGDVPHFWRRLRTGPINHRALFQLGYDTVRPEAKSGKTCAKEK